VLLKSNTGVSVVTLYKLTTVGFIAGSVVTFPFNIGGSVGSVTLIPKLSGVTFETVTFTNGGSVGSVILTPKLLSVTFVIVPLILMKPGSTVPLTPGATVDCKRCVVLRAFCKLSVMDEVMVSLRASTSVWFSEWSMMLVMVVERVSVSVACSVWFSTEEMLPFSCLVKLSMRLVVKLPARLEARFLVMMAVRLSMSSGLRLREESASDTSGLSAMSGVYSSYLGNGCTVFTSKAVNKRGMTNLAILSEKE